MSNEFSSISYKFKRAINVALKNIETFSLDDYNEDNRNKKEAIQIEKIEI